MMTSIDKATNTTTKSENIDEYTLLRDMILREQLMPNERIVEQEYALRFGTSRANIRKALTRLEQDGLVVQEPFRGAHVRRITMPEAVEMFEIRGALEVMLMPHVCERITEADKKILKNLMQKIVEAARSKDPITVGAASRKIREELWRISGHSTGAKLLLSLNTQLVRTWYKTRTVPGRADAIAEQLSVVIDAVLAPSPSKAISAMKRYHDAAVLNLKRAMSIDDRSV